MPGLAPNALSPCGTTAARIRHAAHGVTCHRCGVEGRPHVVAYVTRLETELADITNALAAAQAELETVDTSRQQYERLLRSVNDQLTTERKRRVAAEQAAKRAVEAQRQQDPDRCRLRLTKGAEALELLLRHPVIHHDPLERVRAFLAGERRSL